MPRYRVDVTVAKQSPLNDDYSESDVMSGDVAEGYVFVVAVEHKDIDVRFHLIYYVANNTEIALKHLSEI